MTILTKLHRERSHASNNRECCICLYEAISSDVSSLFQTSQKIQSAPSDRLQGQQSSCTFWLQEEQKLQTSASAPDKSKCCTQCKYTNRQVSTNHILTIKQGWDAPKNHFGCYMDVKPCNVSHTNIMDLVKEPDILERFNGFRIHKVKSQLEDGVSVILPFPSLHIINQ